MQIQDILDIAFNPVMLIFILLTMSSCSSSHHRVENNTTSIYWVNSHKVPCEGVAPMQCLQVKKAENESWQYFYSQIVGFDFEPGYLYKIEVREEGLDPSQLPQDVSSIKYTLVSVLEKNPDPFYSLFGTYQGTLPCADCEGIETTLKLMGGGTFHRDSRYLGKQEQPFVESGNFELRREASLVTLGLGDGNTQYYLFEDGALLHLDQQGNRMVGDLAERYKLTKKMTDTQLEDQKWILTHLMGQEVVRAAGNTDATILFDSKEERAAGNSSCNQYNCTYELLPDHRIKIYPCMVSLMACENMDTENRYNQMLPKVDRYTVIDTLLSFQDAENIIIAQYRLAEEGE